ncbi:MAG TPA: VOC family protein [Acidobacteriaceae bacterium]|jgi:catechol 2,3-dioxygenase-like lactoylglutathione lyase family enzyme|nr:VOC family protein [Acidobacteriaceae bacterium]
MALDVRGATTLLQVYDMPASVRFYRDVLGFEMVSHSPHRGGDPDRFHWCWLRLGGAELMLNTAYESDEERPVHADETRMAAHGDTGLFFGCPDVDAAYEELRAKDVNVSKPHVAPYGMKQMSLRDPDGYGLCFQWEAKAEAKH